MAPRRPAPAAECPPSRAQSAGAGFTHDEMVRVRAWTAATAELHARVRASCWDSLIGELLRLHAPVIEGSPVCRGCDRDCSADPPPTWPCRTYEVIATKLLGINVDQIESLIGARYDIEISRG